MHKITQFFYRFSLYFTAVITGLLLVMSMVCMYGYQEYLSGGSYALGNVAVILLAIASEVDQRPGTCSECSIADGKIAAWTDDYEG